MPDRIYIYEGEVVLSELTEMGEKVGDAIELVDEVGQSGEDTSLMARLAGKRAYVETPTLAEILEVEFGGGYAGSSKFHQPEFGDRSLGRLRLTVEYPCLPEES